MKKLLLLVFILGAHLGRAQNWQCLQPGVKHYFTNSNGYLRGIRIDSVKTYADSVVYYPFHTPRGRYYNWSSTALDSTGGSWLGKHVVQLGDGTFLFDNLWGDTIIIKSQASVGDSWVFCRDTSSLYYRADLVAKDTMTVLGTLDSVKTVLITARRGSSIVTTDMVDSFQIILSKNNGFVQVFDLYTFPYHKPDTAYCSGLDYFLDKVISDPLARTLVRSDNLIFRLVPFTSPTFNQLYQWNAGDVYEYSHCFGDLEEYGTFCDPPKEYDLDTITAITVTSGSTAYDYKGWRADLIVILDSWGLGPTPAQAAYTIATNAGRFTDGSSFLINSDTLPEEFHQKNLLYYLPDDSSFCVAGALYKMERSDVDGANYFARFESGGPNSIYKIPLGLLHYYESYAGSDGFFTTDHTLLYYNRGGLACGYYTPPRLSVENIDKRKRLLIFPNPTTNELTINTTTLQRYTITLINTLGQTIKTIACNKQQQTINTTNIPAGVYTISITDENGNRYNEKVVIVH
jgi:hypothetical protein